MRRLTRRLVLPIFGVLWITVLLFFWVTKKKLEVPAGPEVQTPKIPDADWDDLWDQFDERRYLNAKKWRVGDDPYKLYAFNQRESERIASSRVVPDTRLFRTFQRADFKSKNREKGQHETEFCKRVCWLTIKGHSSGV